MLIPERKTETIKAKLLIRQTRRRRNKCLPSPPSPISFGSTSRGPSPGPGGGAREAPSPSLPFSDLSSCDRTQGAAGQPDPPSVHGAGLPRAAPKPLTQAPGPTQDPAPGPPARPTSGRLEAPRAEQARVAPRRPGVQGGDR